MKFVSKEHEAFYNQRLLETYDDEYYRAFWYTIGLTTVTRTHYKDIYDFENKGINFEALNKPWQTSSTSRVVRLAFNLFNGWAHESMSDCENGLASKEYAVDNIFCDGLAPYFYQAICLRYPSYTAQ